MGDPLDLPTVSSESPTEPDKPDRDLPGYRYARALCETARAAAGDRCKGFQKNFDYLMGKDQWAAPSTSSAQSLDKWAFRGVVNWTYATVKTKAAMITSQPQDIFCDPLDEESSYLDRLTAKSAMEHSMKRNRMKQVGYDMYMWGSVTGVGIGMVTAKPDELTGTMASSVMPIKSSELFRDPSADSITSPDCRFVVWEPELDMSTIRRMWPSKAPYVKPEIRQVTGGFTYKTDKTDDNLIYGTGGEFVVDQQNILRSRKARVSFVWIKDESIVEDLQEIILKEPSVGYHCISCDAIHEPESTPGITVDSPCPMCGGDMEPYQIPAKMEQNRIVRRRYPYGRMIAYSGETLLYDGENPLEIEGVFPFFIYHHDRIPGDFYGGNDVTMLESLQDAQNRTIGQGIDGVRLSMFGPFEYPVSCKSYTELGNGPAERHPVPDHLSNKAHFLAPPSANLGLWQGVLNALEHQFQILSGLAPMGMGIGSTPPISATEAEITNARLTDRMKAHAQSYAQALSDGANILWQVERQLDRENGQIPGYSPTTVPMQMPNSEVKSIQVEFSKLPNVNIRIEVNSDSAIKDKILGQNSVPIFTNPAMMESPYLEDVLQAIGHPANRVKEIMMKRGLQQEIAPGAQMPPVMQEGGMVDA